MPRITPTPIPASGSITNAMLASPTAGVYDLVLQASGAVTTTAASGTKYWFDGSTTNASAIGAGGTNPAIAQWFNFVAADYSVTGLTPKLMLRATCDVATAPAITITVGLYPVTQGATITLGNVVTNSTIAFTTPAQNTVTTGQATDFTVPSDGVYALGLTVSSVPSGNISVHGSLYVRNI